MLIHDLPKEESEKIFTADRENLIICGDDGTLHQCIGCFSCWINTPGVCPMQDSFAKIYEMMSSSNEIILVSRCVFGGLSPFVKNAVDRAMPYLAPELEIRNNETCYHPRNQCQDALTIHFYGPVNDDNKKTAVSYANNLAREWNVIKLSVLFHETYQELGGVAI
ncbi:MAG TPA: hypothetical protein PLN48_00330 [Lachnospiraceae bacterium]|nr:hypothetical protein [Lachnospiraceae bacterium]